MIPDSIPYILIAAAGPIVTAAAQQPQALFEGTAASVLGAVGLAIWRCANLATRWLEASSKHRDLEIRQWEAADKHREAERAHWAK